MVVDLIRFMAIGESDNQLSVGLLLTIVFLLFLVISTLFGFHLYLSAVNLTTWEFLKWEKVEYLNIFDKAKLSSPFDKGLKQNVQTLWANSRV